MLEALEKIKSAEEQNEQKKEQLLADLSAYEASKKKLLQEESEQLRTDFSNVLAQREQILSDELEKEEQNLSKNADDAMAKMEEDYHSKRQQTIQKIIERVITEYGR